MGGSSENGRRHGRLSLLGLREVAVLFLCKLEAASAVELSSVRGNYVLVAFQEERKLQDVLVSLSAGRATRLVPINSHNSSRKLPMQEPLGRHNFVQKRLKKSRSQELSGPSVLFSESLHSLGCARFSGSLVFLSPIASSTCS
jgi:hypothetical protein